MTFTEMRDDLAARLYVNSTAGLTRLGNAINKHYKRITAGVGLQVARRAAAPIVATATISNQYITVSGLEKVERVFDDSSGSVRMLDEVLIDELREENPNTSDEPTRYAIYKVTSSTVTLLMDVLAQTAYTLKVDGLETAATLSGSLEPAFPESYHDVIVESVMAEELRKKGKVSEAAIAAAEARRILSDLRMFIAKSGYLELHQGEKKKSTAVGGAAAGGGSAPSGGTSYTQTGLITFDRDPNAPFAVTASSAVVPNLDADKLDGEEGADFHNTAKLTDQGGLLIKTRVFL